MSSLSKNATIAGLQYLAVVLRGRQAARPRRTLLNEQVAFQRLLVVAKFRQLEDENRRLKKIVADQALNIEALKIVAEGNF